MSSYLKTGDQTILTSKIIRIAEGLSGKGLDAIFSILNWIHTNIKDKSNDLEKINVFRKRTAEKIIADGFATGCTDYALVFAALARAKKIPTKYVESIEKEWLKNPDWSGIRGHVFCEVQLNKKWYIVDPQGALIKAWYGKRYEILGKGLDSWDLEIYDVKDLIRLIKKKYFAQSVK